MDSQIIEAKTGAKMGIDSNSECAYTYRRIINMRSFGLAGREVLKSEQDKQSAQEAERVSP